MSFESVIEFLKQNIRVVEIVSIILLIILIGFLVVAAIRFEGKNGKETKPIKKMVALSMLAALSVVLYYYVKFPLAGLIQTIPSFLDIHFSNVPIYIGGYLFGPFSGTIIAIIRFIVKLPGSSTLGVGELADLIIGVVTVIISSMIYHKKNSLSNKIWSAVSIPVIWTIIGVVSNWLVILPFYIGLYDFETILAMLQVIPGINESNYMVMYLLYAILPFNLILSIMVSIITFLLNNRLMIIYEKL